MHLPIVFVFLSSLSYSAANRESHFKAKRVNAQQRMRIWIIVSLLYLSSALRAGFVKISINVRFEKWRLGTISGSFFLCFLSYHARLLSVEL